LAWNGSYAKLLPGEKSSKQDFAVGDVVEAEGMFGWYDAKVEEVSVNGDVKVAWIDGSGRKSLHPRYVRAKGFVVGDVVEAEGTFGWYEARVEEVSTNGDVKVAWIDGSGTKSLHPRYVRAKADNQNNKRSDAASDDVQEPVQKALKTSSEDLQKKVMRQSNAGS
jgi:hypothetical protein